MVATREPSPPVITTKAQLVFYLGEAAVLEHQFMCQYLYAAFSLKKAPDATCTPAQFEHVRRWASTIYLIARQEMEHLSVVNSILTAIGGQPVLYHLDFPTQSAWYQGATRARREREGDGEPVPCDLPFLMVPFDLDAARRFCCMESPILADLPPIDRARVTSWCYQDAAGQCGCTGGARADLPVAPRFAMAPEAPPETVAPGTIQELYAALEQGLVTLDAQLGTAALFDGHPSGQAEIPSEYQIYLYPIGDLSSALAGLRMITKQGEGLDAPPGYDAHFQLFYDLAVDYEALLADDPAFRPSLPMAADASASGYAAPQTRIAVALWRDGYATLLYMLTGYFASYTKQAFGQYPYLSAALSQTTFAPLMTMLVRSLGEVIAGLPGEPYAPCAGVDFNLTQEELRLLFDPTQPPFRDIAFYRDRVESLVARLDQIEHAGPVPEDLVARIRYIRENMFRVWGNLAQIYQKGVFPPFDPNTPYPSCPT
jgi:hypothetical protein